MTERPASFLGVINKDRASGMLTEVAPQARAMDQVSNQEKKLSASENLAVLADEVMTQTISTRQDFMHQVFNKIASALGAGGYDGAQASQLIQEYIEQDLDFNQGADISHLLYEKIIALGSVVAQQSEQPRGETSVVLEARPEPLALTKLMRVDTETSSPPTPLESLLGVERVEAMVPPSPFQVKLDTLNEQSFNFDEYFKLAYNVFAASRDSYDTVLKNPKQYISKIFAPSDNEKAAIKLRGQMQKHHSRMRFLREDVVISLENPPATFNETEVKFLVAKFVAHSERLLAEAAELKNLYEKIKTEEKPSVVEVYRVQFETMKVDGNKVLATLPTDHPHYTSFKQMIEGDLAKLITNAAVENDGDTYVTQSFSFISLKRNQIKAATAYFKAEQEHQNFKERQLEQVRVLESAVGKVSDTLSDDARTLQKQIFLNIDIIKNKLGAAGELPDGVELARLAELTLQEATTDFTEQKEFVKELLQETAVILEEFQKRTPPLAVPEAIAAPPTHVEGELPPLVLGIEETLAVRREELQRSVPESSVSRKRLAAILTLFTPKRVGYLAAVVAASALFGDTQPGQANFQSATLNPLLGMASLSQPRTEERIDRTTIETFLKSSAPDSMVEEFKAMALTPLPIPQTEVEPSVPSYQPEPIQTELEVVPGVTLHTTKDETLVRSLAPELKIFGKADEVRIDPDFAFLPSEKIESAAPVKNELYKISYGDVFWDIAEGQSLAGTLAVMKQINPYFKQALIDRLRDAINNDKQEREKIGGFGKTADELVTGGVMNLEKLNMLAVLLAINYGYLQ